MRFIKSIPPHIRDLIGNIRSVAQDKYGLDFFETIFEMVDYKTMNEIAAFGGFPTRYPHWRFGMEYDQLSKSHTYGLSKIYEMVINNDPSYAYLLEGNNLVDQKTVISHVYAHVDFFKNNYYFSKTNRNMVDEMANHGARMRRYVDKHGIEKVEDFVDTCLSLENLIDYHAPFIERRGAEDDSEDDGEVPKFEAKSYMEDYINPGEFLEKQKKKLEEQRERKKKVPSEPQRDILRFLIDQAPLEDWEADILSMIREEAYYFAPQRQTKIMNEGWASYWHSKILTEEILDDSEIVDFADIHSGVMATPQGGFNPYKVGIELYRHIEERWNQGKFGKEWEEIDDMERKSHWDKQLGLGRDKIFEVRKLYNDVTFIDEFLTEEFVREQNLFTYEYNPKQDTWEIASRQFEQIKEKLLRRLTNFGEPFIFVKDGNFRNRTELLLHHKWEGTPLQMDQAKEVLESLERVWKRPVNLETRFEDEGLLMTFDGDEHTHESWDYESI
jgi:stage V sporulation protein R